MTLTQEQLDSLKSLREELLSTRVHDDAATIHRLCGLGLAEVVAGVPRITSQGLGELARHGIGEPVQPHF